MSHFYYSFAQTQSEHTCVSWWLSTAENRYHGEASCEGKVPDKSEWSYRTASHVRSVLGTGQS